MVLVRGLWFSVRGTMSMELWSARGLLSSSWSFLCPLSFGLNYGIHDHLFFRPLLRDQMLQRFRLRGPLNGGQLSRNSKYGPWSTCPGPPLLGTDVADALVFLLVHLAWS